MGAADFVGVGTTDFVGVGTGFGVGVAVAVGVGVGVVAAMTSGDGLDAGELPTAVLAAALSTGLTGLALSAPALATLVLTVGEPTAEVELADEG